MRISPTLLLAAGLTLAIAACGEDDAGQPEAAAVDSAAMQREATAGIRAGMSQDDIRNRLGEPRTRVTMDGGFERWTYYSYDADGQITAKTLIIFGSDGKVVEINAL